MAIVAKMTRTKVMTSQATTSKCLANSGFSRLPCFRAMTTSVKERENIRKIEKNAHSDLGDNRPSSSRTYFDHQLRILTE